jgi:hypothetical protein
MLKFIRNAVVFVGGATAATMIWLASDTEKQRTAEAHGLVNEEVRAYKQCNLDFSGKRITFRSATGTAEMRVPDEICLCHAPTIAHVFKDGRYSEHGKIVSYIVNKGRMPDVQEDAVSNGVASSAAAIEQTITSVHRCAAQYQDTLAQRSAALRAKYGP